MPRLPENVLLARRAEQAPPARPLPRLQGPRRQGHRHGGGGRRGRRRECRRGGQGQAGGVVDHLPEVRARAPPNDEARLCQAAQREPLRPQGR